MKVSSLSILFAMLATVSLAQQETQFLFAIYVSETSLWNPPHNPDEIKMTPTPLLTDKDLVSYDWATHVMTINTNTIQRLPVFRYGMQCSNIVVVANGQRCYVGSFIGGEDSISPDSVPHIRISGTSHQRRLMNATLRIEFVRRLDAGDPRNDSRVHDALKKAGKLIDKNEGHPNRLPGN